MILSRRRHHQSIPQMEMDAQALHVFRTAKRRDATLCGQSGGVISVMSGCPSQRITGMWWTLQDLCDWMLIPLCSDSRDDGIFTGLLLGPIIASAFLLISLGKMTSGKLESFPVGWLIEAPAMLKNSVKQLPALQANHLSRYSLCDLSTFCSVILLLHATASHWFERGAGKAVNRPEGERISVPRSEGRRSAYYVIFTIISSILMTSLKIFFTIYDINLWRCKCLFYVWIPPLTPSNSHRVARFKPFRSRDGFSILSVCAVYSASVGTSWVHSRRGWAGLFWRHGDLSRILEHNYCKGA